MRVYEFSKEIGVPSKELLEALKKDGFDVKSHMSVLSESELDSLIKKYKSAQTVSTPKKAEKSEKIHAVQEVVSPKEMPDKMQITIKKDVPQVSLQTINPVTEKKAIANKLSLETSEGETTHLGTKPSSEHELILDSMLVSDAALALNKGVTDVILTLLKWGIIASKNQILSVDVVARLAEHYQVKTIKAQPKKHEVSKLAVTVGSGERKERLPVVVVIGHVDHGKTTLLDFIRKTRVAAKEKGGITQHLGAYEAQTSQGNIVFLDTPGHEAFSKMRMRGIKVADIAILVVAADDGIMPQTIEAIKLAKSMEVPIIVAINKIDKVDALRLETVKRQLAQYDLLPEEWGGQVVVVPISAKEGKNIDQLLDMIILQSQLMELKTEITGNAKGFVLESKIEKGRGPVATIICQSGAVKIGDYFVCGTVSGRVNSMVDSQGQRIKEAGPSIPIQVAGFESLPEAGDYFEVVAKDQQRKGLSEAQDRKLGTTVTGKIRASAHSINLLIKTDSNSSKEALLEAIEKLSKKTEKGFAVVFAGIGNVSESDVELASNTNARIVTLHVRPDQNANLLAQHEDVAIYTYDIIYKLLEALQEMAEQAKEVKMVRKKIGEAYVLRVFDIKNIGVIAGAQVKEGRFSKDGTVVVYRGTKKIGQGKIKSLQRDKKSVKEVHTGFECAFLIEDMTDWQPDDRVECYIEVPEGK